MEFDNGWNISLTLDNGESIDVGTIGVKSVVAVENVCLRSFADNEGLWSPFDKPIK